MDDYIYNSFKQTSVARLINAINRANDTTLVEDEVVFSPPSWHHDESHGTNTLVTLIANPSAGIEGRADFYYKRPSLGELFSSTTPTIGINETMQRTVDLLEPFFQRYRVRLDADDIVDEALPEITGETGTYLLKANSRSLGWVGDLTITLVPITTILDSRITQQFGNLVNVTPMPGTTRAELWFEPKRLLSQVEVDQWMDDTPVVGDGLTAWMIEQIRTYYGPEWSSIPSLVEENNLYNSTIAYVGPNSSDIGVPGSPEDVIVLIKLGAYCLNYSGYLILSLPEHMVRAYHDAEET